MLNSLSMLATGRRPLSALLLTVFALGLGCGEKRREAPRRSSAATSSGDYLDWIDVARRAPAPALRGRRVILIGWDGADWELLDSLMAQGRMPHLSRLTSAGRTAVLESYSPPISPIVWTTIATGATPPDHGVLDFFELDPASGRYAPVPAASRRVPAYWEVASARGLSVGAVNYWATFPAEEVRGFLVSDRACPALVDPDPAQLPSAVYPASYADGIGSVLDGRPLPDAATLSRFGEFLEGEKEATAATMLKRLLRNTRVVQEVGERLYDRDRPESMAIYFLGTDEVSHLFGLEAAPRLPCVSEDRFTRFSEIVPRYYAWMDSLLGRWMRRAEEDGAVLVLVSDHGFKWGARRACGGNPLETSTAAYAHRPEGAAAVWGRGVAPERRRGQASVFDVAPTLSALLGLPVDRREPGRARTEWFVGVARPNAIDLWSQSPPPKLLPAIAPSRTDEYAQRLASLGYLSGGLPEAAAPPGGRRPGATETGYLNLGAWHNSRAEWGAAIEAFRHSLRVRSGYLPAEVDLVTALLRQRRRAEALDAAREALRFPGERLGWAVFEIAARFEQAGLLAEEERFLVEAAARLPTSEPVAVSLAGLKLGQGKCGDALDGVKSFLGPRALPDTLNVAGFALGCVGRPAEARPYLERSISLNPSQPEVRRMLGAGRAERGAPRP